jgi:hypothetical protein
VGDAPLTDNIPDNTVVPPVKVLLPFNISVPEPMLCTKRLPEPSKTQLLHGD